MIEPPSVLAPTQVAFSELPPTSPCDTSRLEAADGAAEGAAAPQYKLVAKWNKEKFEFELAGTLTVGDVKRELECRTKVPGKRQKLIGLGKKANPDDRFIEVAMGAHGRRRKL